MMRFLLRQEGAVVNEWVCWNGAGSGNMEMMRLLLAQEGAVVNEYVCGVGSGSGNPAMVALLCEWREKHP